MKKTTLFVMALISTILILGPFNVLRRTIFSEVKGSPGGRLHMNTGNTVRIEGENAVQVGRQVVDILYPRAGRQRPSGIILMSAESWDELLAVLPLVKNLDSVILPVGKKAAGELLEEVRELRPYGIRSVPADDGRGKPAVLLIGEGMRTFASTFREEGVPMKIVEYSGLDSLQSEVYKLSTASGRGSKEFCCVVSASKPEMSIPAAAFAARYGAAVLFADKDNKLYPSSAEILAKGAFKRVYAIGQKNMANVDIGEVYKGNLVTISGTNPEDLSVRLARFYDPETRAGWNANRRRQERGWSFILCSKKELSMAVIGSQLAASEKSGPLLWTEPLRLSSITENYLWRLKPNYWKTPDEGPFNNLWILGSTSILGYSLQSRVDISQEIQPYKTLGSQGVSGIEAISIIWLCFSFFGALWVGLHSIYRMGELHVYIKVMWVMAVLLLGPVGIWLYIVCYINCPYARMNNNIMWLRPLWKQTATATSMGIAFGGSAFIAAAYILSLAGLPVVPLNLPYGAFLLGNPLVLQIVIAFIISFALNAYLLVPAMEMKLQNITYRKAVRESFSRVFFSMLVESLGILLALWYLNSVYVPEIPEADSVLWWGFAQFSVLAGFLIAYIPNWWLVRYGKKTGTI